MSELPAPSTVHHCDDEAATTAGVAAAVDAIRDGGLIVMPTDTVYGIGCDAFDAGAVSALLAAKGRGRHVPPPVLVPGPATVDGLATEVPGYARELIEEFWPGPLTLVLRAQASLVWDIGETNGTVGLRMPDHPVALAVLRAVGPMAVTSANRTGAPAATTVDDAQAQLGDTVSVYASTLVNPSDSLQWQIFPVKNSDARANISPSGANAQMATISDIRGKGELTLRISNPSIAGCQKEIPLNVGCGCSSSENTCTLDGKYNLSSIDVTLDLGRTKRGKSAGSLQLKADKISADNSTPKKLKVFTVESTTETLYSSNNILRQVVTPEIFVDITPVDDYRYDIKYYTLADKGPKVGGFYQIAGAAIPLKTWRIENPDLSSAVYNRLKITETQNSIVKTYEYIWDQSLGQWQLKNGGGLQNENLLEQTINGNRVVTKTLTDNAGVVAAKT